MEKVLQVENLRKSYNGLTVLDLDSLSIPKGQITVIMGPNGAGKTTLIRILALLEEPDHGTIWLNGQPIPEDENHRLVLRRQMGVIWQRPALFAMSVADNLGLALRLRGWGRKKVRTKVEEYADMFDLGDLLRKWPNELSGGETQKVSVARSLIYEPDIMFIDEPDTYLDLSNRHLVEEMVASQVERRGMTALMVTHSRHQMSRLAANLVILQRGRLRWSGRVDNLETKDWDEELRTFLGLAEPSA
ncbi:MAG: ATP-binding cassette domain-containing protein [Firmicutes bacterium]|nr:ATP-binding cassette domain-containing protein [Bacillota bacterium]